MEQRGVEAREGGRQTRRRLATRQRISDVATRLFCERGFDSVTIDEIAAAADVARMTVFNHFARKEDMFFDLDDLGREELMTALREKAEGVSPVEALREFAHRAVAEERPYVCFFQAGTDLFLATIRGSSALKGRAREIRDELTEMLTAGFAESAKRWPPDAAASLAATLVVATWTVALTEAYRVFQEGKDVAEANATFLRLVDRGSRGVLVALEGTAYR